MAFPGALPSFTGFTSSHTLAQDVHAAQHNLEQSEIVAIATKVGTGSSTSTNNTVLRGNGTGTSAWAQVTLTSDVTGVLPIANGGNGTTSTTGSGSAVFGTSPTISGASLTSSPTLTTPTITDFTNATHTHASNAQGGQLNGANALIDGSVTPAELTSGTGSSWTWQDWTPTWTNLSVGNGTLVAKYTQIGKTVHFRIILLGGTTTSHTGGINFTLPASASSYGAATINVPIGSFHIEKSGVQNFQGFLTIDSAGKCTPLVFGASGTYTNWVAVDTTPLTFGNLDTLEGSGTYEAG